MMRTVLSIMLAAVLSACATAIPPPQVIEPDVARFRVLVFSVTLPESEADRRVTAELDAYRVRGGYAGYEVLARVWNRLPATYYEYTVRFTREVRP